MKILTTVGISICKKFSEYNTEYKADIQKFSELRVESNYDEELAKEIIESIVEWGNNQRNICAEIKCLKAMASKYGEPEEVQLISSDTVQGYICAEAISRLLFEMDINAHYEQKKDVIKGLQVQDERVFQREGLRHLTEYLSRYNEKNGGSYDLENINVAYNFTGGFKSVIPYLTIMAQLFKAPMFYIFEETDELIEIGQTPLMLDYRFFSTYSEIMKKLADMISISEWKEILEKNRDFKYGIQQAKACYTVDGDMVYLNALGQLMYQEYEKHYFVKIYRSSSYFSEEPSKVKRFDQSIKIFCDRLSCALREGTTFDLIQDEDLKHVSMKPYYIAKITQNMQLRILYQIEVEGEQFSIKIYEIIVKQDKYSSDYENIFRQRIKGIKENEANFITIPIPKN